MDDPFVSGEWSGFYLERHRAQRGWMHMFLTFENGKIRGEGTDYVGPWTATGSYDESTKQCQWVKQYVGRHLVEYAGIASENGIQGVWQIVGQGEFHIWPNSHSHFNELYLRDELENSGDFTPSILLAPVSNEELV